MKGADWKEFLITLTIITASTAVLMVILYEILVHQP